MRRRASTLLWLLVLVVVVTGCAAPGPQLKDPEDRAAAQAALQARAAQLTALDTWEVRARLAIRSEHEGWQANVQWRQRADEYRIDLVGPLGQGAMRLTGDADGVVMDAGSEHSVATSPEVLLERETGWRLPVDGLRYWMRGLPQPDTEARFVLDVEGRLQHLEQDGWEVSFPRYTDRGGISLPARLDLRHADLRVRVVVDHWTLTGS